MTSQTATETSSANDYQEPIPISLVLSLPRTTSNFRTMTSNRMVLPYFLGWKFTTIDII
ncbi:hypothetical protein L218DRAFT_741529 [Marasmius fiardii PR-910]|nr:hypothetical protein L218DRAFT_741529 [Marasmius fiardii PR-910]